MPRGAVVDPPPTLADVMEAVKGVATGQARDQARNESRFASQDAQAALKSKPAQNTAKRTTRVLEQAELALDMLRNMEDAPDILDNALGSGELTLLLSC